MSRNRMDDFFFGSRRGNNGQDETIVSPTRNIVRTTTSESTIRRIHPTHITNVNKHIKRIKNFYPVTESYENKCYVEEYDCGSDLKNPCCRRVDR
ncbi:spore coat protein [Bacillus sp. 28A-2]|uniref:spore coat protein n=1 Tax=Bacillus sp. 28A-2 TaxID=2772252 RepID=UPI00168D05CE|nr:spore coat protein [Bacillus sp. 28A-2]MBD3861316.1 spore coat protein [Bacillus sp. 28A-2]